MSGTDWQQTKELLQQITTFFETEDDSPLVRDVVRLRQEMEGIAGERAASSQAKLDRAAAVNENLQNQATRDEDASLHRERIQEQLARQKALKGQIAQLTEKKERLQADIASIQKLKRRTMEQTEEQDADRRDQVPRVSHTVELYAKVSNIRWTTDSPEVVQGFVALNGAKEVRRFEMNRGDMPRAEMVNQLWDMME